jgi:MFS family permease
MRDRLVTPRFLIMCAYSFTVFVSLFSCCRRRPYHVIDLGGGTVAAGLFLGFLTFASALSAPFTGAIGDRVGQRHVLMTVSLVLAAFTASYALIRDYRLAARRGDRPWPVLVGIAVGVRRVHDVDAAALSPRRRAGLLGALIRARHWRGAGDWILGVPPRLAALCWELTTLNALMFVIAWRLPDDLHGAHGHDPAAPAVRTPGHVIEWRVLLLSSALAVISFGYGGLTSFSALYADELRISPRSLFLSVMAVSMLVARLTLGRSIDRVGHRRVLTRCLVIPPIGLALLTVASGAWSFGLAAFVFGAGFGLMHPSFTAYMIGHVSFARRGAAFGAMLAAFDTGIGLGSSVIDG